eukprot:2307689-Amphidinium_carterae.1
MLLRFAAARKRLLEHLEKAKLQDVNAIEFGLSIGSGVEDRSRRVVDTTLAAVLEKVGLSRAWAPMLKILKDGIIDPSGERLSCLAG